MSVAFLLLAIRADAEKFELVDYGLEAAANSNAVVEFCHSTMFNLNHARTAQTHEVMVVAVITVQE